MKRTIYQQLEAVAGRLMAADGKCIIIAHDGESESGMLSAVLHDADEATGMFLSFFRRFTELIPKALAAASLAMECDGDCDNCGHCPHDDDEDDDDEGGELIIGMN